MGIDVGLDARKAKKHIPLGTRVTFRPHFESLLGDRVCAKALDDRAGVAAILHALRLLDGVALSCDMAVVFAAQEELGCRGSAVAAFAVESHLRHCHRCQLRPDARRPRRQMR